MIPRWVLYVSCLGGWLGLLMNGLINNDPFQIAWAGSGIAWAALSSWFDFIQWKSGEANNKP